jgi:cell division protein FtsW (lipid II flippase)
MPLVKDGFSSSMTLAVASLFFFEAVIVIAGCTGLIPLTGVTLPFISQGGSSLLAKMILVGILLGLMSRRNELEVML